MVSVFWRQFGVLLWKNWIILLKHPFLNVLRCFLLPVAYGIFLAVAQVFLLKPNNYGIGSPTSVYSLASQFDSSSSLIWADATSGNTSSPTPDQIMSRISQDFTSSQLSSIKKVATPDDIPAQCPQNFNLFSECYAAVAFYDIPPLSGNSDPRRSVNYTIRADAGLAFIDVVNHASDYEKRIMPLQWAIDQAIIELQTSTSVPVPLEWPFSQETNEEQSRDTRLSFIRGIRELLVLAFFVCFVGISYQLPGAVANERSTLLTSHLQAMGLSDFPRILSLHVSISLAYLPAWIIVALVWHYRIYVLTPAIVVVIIHFLLGMSLASYAFFICAPFSSRSPQLAAVASTFITIVLAIVALVLKRIGNVGAFIFSVVFPPGYYVFVQRALAGYENHQLKPNVVKGDPDNGLAALPLIIAAIIDVFLWPWLAAKLERRLYDARLPSKAKSRSWLRPWTLFRKSSTADDASAVDNVSEGTAISIQNVSKIFKTSALPSFALRGNKKKRVTAIIDLSIDIPLGGIFVLLGSNGAGKSTIMQILAGILGPTSGTVTYSAESGLHSAKARRSGGIGIVPQKNVLFPELTCLQTLKVWRAVKCGWSSTSAEGKEGEEDLEQLLRDCDLESKINENAGVLSGGQKRKLQLAIGLVGGSKILLVDECTSGVDPLSRRALWRTLTSVRMDRTVIFTTHFLDEADLLADHISILAAPGKLVADSSPVKLKRDLGQGYSVAVTFVGDIEKRGTKPSILLDRIRSVAPETYTTSPSSAEITYHLKLKDTKIVQKVLEILDKDKDEYSVKSYDIVGTTIEDIFLDLMAAHDRPDDVERIQDSPTPPADLKPASLESGSGDLDSGTEKKGIASLAHGRASPSFHQALTIFYKRWLILRRSWLSPLLAVLIAIAGSTIPLVFLTSREPTCVRTFRPSFGVPLYLPAFELVQGLVFGDGNGTEATVLQSPPNVISSALGNFSAGLVTQNINDNATFVSTIQQNYRNLSLGGISYDANTRNTLIAWEATVPGTNGPVVLNMASNLLYNSVRNATSSASQAQPRIIQASFEAFPPVAAGTLVALKWVVFFGLAMSVFPAFFALYVSEERKVSLVQAMQFSNGLSNTIGLWIGHLMFDAVFTLISCTIIIIVFAAVSNQFHGLGLLWFIMILYGIAGTLFAYCVSLVTSSPLAAFASAAGYQVVMFVLYIAGYLLTLTYAKTSEAGRIIDLIHFTLSILSPIASLMRAAFVSVNLFSLLCNGDSVVTSSSEATLKRFSGPILYLFVYSAVLLAILVWSDSGSVIISRISSRRGRRNAEKTQNSANKQDDVAAEARYARSSEDLLRVMDVTKHFGKNKVVDDVSLSVPEDTTMALLGPNGAGKTTTFNVIRGDILPDGGEVLINGTSVISHPRKARLSLGVCPQFTAIDSQLSVREHLVVYGLLKGLRRGSELNSSVNILLNSTGLDVYADRLASRLSGGNARKLSLAIAMMGNPPVILIDEFSTGVDARMKREMWQTLRTVAIGKSVVITTHSMEEASAIANKVAIIAKQLLAVGPPTTLTERYYLYEVHFTCRTREDKMNVQKVMAEIPNARMADDVATRFEVPIPTSPSGQNGNSTEAITLSSLFARLSSHSDLIPDYTVEKVTLESVFLKVIRENQVREDEGRTRRTWRFWQS